MQLVVKEVVYTVAEGRGVRAFRRRWTSFNVMLVLGVEIGGGIVPFREVRTTGVWRVREGVVECGVPPSRHRWSESHGSRGGRDLLERVRVKKSWRAGWWGGCTAAFIG